MSTIESIRQKHRKGMSISQICREEKVDFKTAKKYIEQEDFSEPLPVKKEKPKATDPYKAWRKTLKNDPGFSHLVWYPGEAQADSVILIQGMKKAM